MRNVKPRQDTMERVSEEEFLSMQQDHPEFRKLWGGNNKKNKNLIEYADPGQDYDMWSQAYRMLGGFIDCDHHKSEGSGDQNNGDNGADNEQACSRWMMWAAVSK